MKLLNYFIKDESIYRVNIHIHPQDNNLYSIVLIPMFDNYLGKDKNYYKIQEPIQLLSENKVKKTVFEMYKKLKGKGKLATFSVYYSKSDEGFLFDSMPIPDIQDFMELPLCDLYSDKMKEYIVKRKHYKFASYKEYIECCMGKKEIKKEFWFSISLIIKEHIEHILGECNKNV